MIKKILVVIGSTAAAASALILYGMLLQNVGLEPAPVLSAQALPGVPLTQGDAYDFETITVSSVAIGFTSSKVSSTGVPSAKAAIITIETNPLRYRYDGTAPTTTVGHLRAATDTPLVVWGINNIRNFKMIRQGGADASVSVTYIR
jgi:hypothetical protein